MRTLNVHVALQSGAYLQGSREVDDANDRMARSSRRVGDSAARMGQQIKTALLGLGIERIFRAVITEAGQFEQGLVGVGKTAGIEGAALKALGAEVEALARRIPVTTQELLAIGQAAGQVGVTGQDNILAFIETIARLGTASDLAGEQAAISLAQILNVTGEGAEGVETLASIIVALGNDFETSESKIARMTNEIARGVAIFGVSSAEAASMAATMSAFGVQSELAGSAVGRVFRDIQAAVMEGGDDLRAFAEVAGVSASTLAEAWASSPFEAFDLFVQGLSQSGDQAAIILGQLGLKGDELAKTIPILAKNYDRFAEAQAFASAETAKATALLEESDKSFDTMLSDLRVFANVVQEAGRSVGEQLAPTVREIVGDAKAWIGENQALIESIGQGVAVVVKLAADNIGLLSAAVGVLLGYRLVAWVVAGVTAIQTKIAATLALNGSLAAVQAGYGRLVALNIAQSFKAWTAGVVTFNGALTATTGILGAVLVAVGLLAAGVSKHVQSMQDDIDGMVEAGKRVRETWEETNEAIATGNRGSIEADQQRIQAEITKTRQRIAELRKEADAVQASRFFSGGIVPKELAEFRGEAVKLGEALSVLAEEEQNAVTELKRLQLDAERAEKALRDLEAGATDAGDGADAAGERYRALAEQLKAVNEELLAARRELAESGAIRELQEFQLEVSIDTDRLEAQIEQIAQEVKLDLELSFGDITVDRFLAANGRPPGAGPAPASGPPPSFNASPFDFVAGFELLIDTFRGGDEYAAAFGSNVEAVGTGISMVTAGLAELGAELGLFTEQQLRNSANLQIAGQAIGEQFGGKGAGAAAGAAGALLGFVDLGRTGTSIAQGAATGAQVGGGYGAIVGAFVGWAADAMSTTVRAFADGSTEGGRLTANLIANANEFEAQTNEITRGVVDTVNGILDAIGGTFDSFETFGIQLREDGEKVKVWINGAREVFDNLGQAMDYLVTQIFRQSEISGVGETVKAALDQFGGTTVDELQQVLSDALTIDNLGLPEIGQRLKTDLHELNRLLDLAIQDFGVGFEQVLNAPGGIAGTIQDAYREAFGIPEDVAAQTRANIEAVKARVEVEKAHLLALKASILAEADRARAFATGAEINVTSARIFIDSMSHTGMALEGFARVSGAAAQVFGTAALDTANALGAIDSALATLESLDFSEGAINAAIARAQAAANGAGGGGGGGRSNADIRGDFAADLAVLRQQAAGAGEGALALSDSLAQLHSRLEDAARAGVSAADREEFRQLSLQQYEDALLAPFRAITAAANDNGFTGGLDDFFVRYEDAFQQAWLLAQATADEIVAMTGDGLEIGQTAADEFHRMKGVIDEAFGVEISGKVQDEIERLQADGDIAGLQQLLEDVGLLLSQDLPAGVLEALAAVIPELSGLIGDAIKETFEASLGGLIDSMGAAGEEFRRGAGVLGPYSARLSAVNAELDRFKEEMERVQEEARLTGESTEGLGEAWRQLQLDADTAIRGIGLDFLGELERLGIEIPGLSEQMLELQRTMLLVELASLAANDAFVAVLADMGLTVEGLTDLINDTFDGLLAGTGAANDNVPGSTSAGAGQSTDAAEDYVNAWEELQARLAEMRALDLGPVTQQAHQMLDGLDELRALAEEVGPAQFDEALAAIDEAFEIQVAAWLDEIFGPYEDLDLSDGERRFAEIQAHFADIAEALEVMGLGGEHLIRLQEAQQAALEAFFGDLTSGVSSLLEDLTGGERSSVPLFDRVQAAQDEFAQLAAAALSGDISAIEDLPGAAELLLELAEDFFGGGAGFGDIREFVIGLLGQVEDLDLSALGIGDDGGLGSDSDRPGRDDILGGLISRPVELRASDLIARPLDLREVFQGGGFVAGGGALEGPGVDRLSKGLADVADAIDHQTGQLTQLGERQEDLAAEQVRQGDRLQATATKRRGAVAA